VKAGVRWCMVVCALNLWVCSAVKLWLITNCMYVHVSDGVQCSGKGCVGAWWCLVVCGCACGMGSGGGLVGGVWTQCAACAGGVGTVCLCSLDL